MAKRDELFKGAMATLGLTFNRDTTPVMDVYWEALASLTEAEMVRGFTRALQECRFMPVPAELLAFAGHAPRDLTAEATMAWGAVRNAMDKLDVYGNVDFGPLVNAVVRNLGGWLYLCESKLSELEWRRKDFERVYKLWADKDVSMFDGSPHFGEWKNAPVTAIQIPGMPTRLPALDAVQTPQAKAMRDVVRELVEAKSLAGAAVPSGGPTMEAAGQSTQTASPPPLRETKRPTRITEEEKAAALAKINAQIAALHAADGSAVTT